MLKRPELPDGFQGRSFYRQNLGGGQQHMCDSPLIGWWWANRVVFQESQTSAFWFQPVWGPCACAQPEVLFHVVWGLSSCRRTQRCVSNCYAHPSLQEELGPGPIPTLLLFLHPLTPLISNCLNLPFGPQRRSRRWKPFSYKQEMGDTESTLYLGEGHHRVLLSPPFSLILLNLEGWQKNLVLGGLGFTTTLRVS